MGFSRQQYWSGLSFPSPENLPDPGIKIHISYVSHIWQVGSLPLVSLEAQVNETEDHAA